MREAMFCAHANEVPCYCPCDNDCYCKTHTCKARAKASNVESCETTNPSSDLEYVLGFLEEYQDAFEHYVLQHTHASAVVVCEHIKNTLLDIKDKAL